MSWSYSKLLVFEQCRYHYKLRHIDKLAEDKHPAAERGTQVHQYCEDFVTGKLKSLATEMLKFDHDFIALKREYVANNVSLEGEWGFDSDWNVTAYKTAWLRMKADAVVFNKAKTEAIVVDYKTGQKFGNEIKHGEQVQLYALATAIRVPTVKKIKVELWYLDKDDLTQTDYTREHALNFVKPFHKRAMKLENAKTWEPNPNVFTCKYCPYGPQKQNICPHGMTSSMTLSNYRKQYA